MDFSFATRCDINEVGDKIICDCIRGYAGERCEKCAAGYYGTPEITGLHITLFLHYERAQIWKQLPVVRDIFSKLGTFRIEGLKFESDFLWSTRFSQNWGHLKHCSKKFNGWRSTYSRLDSGLYELFEVGISWCSE